MLELGETVSVEEVIGAVDDTDVEGCTELLIDVPTLETDLVDVKMLDILALLDTDAVVVVALEDIEVLELDEEYIGDEELTPWEVIALDSDTCMIEKNMKNMTLKWTAVIVKSSIIDEKLNYVNSYVAGAVSEVFCIKGVPKNIDKNQEKNLILESLFNQVAGLHHATLLKKRLHYRCFPI